MSEYRWHKGFFRLWERRITRGIRIMGSVWKNAHDGKTFVAGIEKSSGDTGPYFYEIEFHHKTAADAKRWVDKQIPWVRRKVTEWRKSQMASSTRKGNA